MHIVFEHGGCSVDLELVVRDAEATVADLAAALGRGLLHVDGRAVEGGRRLARAGIREGSTVSFSPSPAKDQTEGATEVRVVGGLAAGGTTRLGAGRWPLGRGDDRLDLASTTVSGHHAVLAIATGGTVTITDAGSRNGTWVDGVPATRPASFGRDAIVRLGAVQLEVATGDDATGDAAAALPRPGAGGTVPFNRPPRAAPPPELDPLLPPEPPEPARATSPIGVVSILAPLVLGVVMIKLLGSLLFGLFALLTPVMVIGGAVEARRRRRKGSRRDRQRFDREIAAFAGELSRRAAVERARLVELAPDPSTVVARATGPSTRLWERRPGHTDFLRLRVGLGPTPWTVPVVGDHRHLHPELRSVVERRATIEDAPVVMDFADGAVLGLVGDRSACLAVARSLVVQAATHHGPADIELAAVVAPGHGLDWDWTKWLPHSRDPTTADERRLCADPDRADDLLRGMLEASAPVRTDAVAAGPAAKPQDDPTTLLVVDDEALTSGRRAPARSVLRGGAGPVAGIVIAASEDRLPSVCTTVVDLLDRDGTAELHHLTTGVRIGPFLATGVDEPTARRSARALARLDDPERSDRGANLPGAVALLPLLASGELDADELARRWADAGPNPALLAPIGVGEDGPLAIDLVADGPHALVAGTTGAGKSELLRSLVAGLAAGCSPDHLTLVLIDFKGGSAFDECARLPHTVGLVTDLDAQLAERALRCMEAELRHRERRLRAAGAADLDAYRRRAPADADPLPRLVVVIDEFATLKAELGDFVDSLVGIAQRGRSLGVHLVLATQRPAGAVSDTIRANTNLRIALRVQDAADSQDVIDRDDAATLPRNRPGRALVRLGPGEVLTVQTALSGGLGRPGCTGRVAVEPFRFGPGRASSRRAAPDLDGAVDHDAGGDLAALVDAARRAHHRSGRPEPRRPWPAPLPLEVDLDGLGPGAEDAPSTVLFALADDPDRQEQYPTGWDLTTGNLLLLGLPGSGTTTACSSVVLALAARRSPAELHVHVLDLGAGELAALSALPHVGSVVLSGQRERQARLVGWLRAELDRRRSSDAARPTIVVVIDGLAGLRSEWEDGTNDVVDQLQLVCADGPELGVHLVITADRLGTVPPAIQGLVRQRWSFRLADPHEYAAIGIPPAAVPALPAGGAIVAELRQQVQVARPADGPGPAVARIASGWPVPLTEGPVGIDALPQHVDASPLSVRARLTTTPWFVPFAIDDHDRAPTGFTFHPGAHALIAGPSRSGRSTALATIARVLHGAASRPQIVVVAEARSPLRSTPHADLALDPSDLDPMWPPPPGGWPPTVVLVDDAEMVPDEAVAALLAQRHDRVHVVAAGRNEGLRSLFAHWTRTVRQSRSVLLLQPDLDLDGDLAAVTLPRRSPVPTAPGRGYLVADGVPVLVQVASEVV